MNKIPFKRKYTAVAIAMTLTFLGAQSPARADERGELEQLRATTMGLIEALVETGAITRDKADKLVREAEQRAKQRVAEAATAAPAQEVGKDGKRIVRVPFVSESMRRDMREQIKQEVLAQAKEERWANPGALPEWLDRFQFEGDLRLRYDGYKLDKSNSSATAANFATNNSLTRAADLTGTNGNPFAVPNGNTQEDFSRTRIRARLGVNAKLSDMVSAGIRFSTGNTTGPTSTNQTLGQNFNKYSVVLDRGFINLHPTSNLTLSGGRINNPFMSTDLVWAEDLGFEGIAASYKPQITPDLGAFVTAGWFPLRTDIPAQSSPRDISGLQGGFNWKLAPSTEFKFGAALYNFRAVEGQAETNARFVSAGNSVSDYGTRYEYPNGLRQRGNTLFILNAPADNAATATQYWGLASGFRELNFTGSLDIGVFGPNHVVLTGDYVKNLAYSRPQITQRTGFTTLDGSDTGYLARILVGRPLMQNRGDWNASLAYRRLGSDAVLDAFTNSDFGLGGTNNKGFIAGVNYAFDKQTWVTVRWMGSEPIDSYAPKIVSTATPTKFAVDLMQVDLNVKF